MMRTAAAIYHRKRLFVDTVCLLPLKYSIGWVPQCSIKMDGMGWVSSPFHDDDDNEEEEEGGYQVVVGWVGG